MFNKPQSKTEDCIYPAGHYPVPTTQEGSLQSPKVLGTEGSSKLSTNIVHGSLGPFLNVIHEAGKGYATLPGVSTSEEEARRVRSELLVPDCGNEERSAQESTAPFPLCPGSPYTSLRRPLSHQRRSQGSTQQSSPHYQEKSIAMIKTI